MVQNKFNVVVFVVLGGAVFATPKMVNTIRSARFRGRFGFPGEQDAGKVVSKANQACLYFCGAVCARSKMVNTSTLNLLWGRFGRVGGLAGGSK